MALILLINLGAFVGWLASIVLRMEAPGTIIRMMGIGIAASLVAGLIANGGVFLGSLSWLAAGAAFVTAIAATIIYFVALHREVQA